MTITANQAENTNSKHNTHGTKPSETAAMVSAEFQKFLADIEDLVKASTSLTGDDLAKVKNEINARIAAAKHSVLDAGTNIAERAKKAADISNTYVHEQPWQVIGAGSVIGFLLGYLIARRS
jgi:ElaB/YqjD/DUF883 family membrane-anchored ribosome-binding protein